MDFPAASQIRERLRKGFSHLEAVEQIPQESQTFNRHAKFKMTTSMSNDNGDSNRVNPEDINKDTFRWRTGDKEHKIEEMDLDLKLAAFTHSLKHANQNFSKYNHHSSKAEKFHNNTKYFMKLCEILEDSLMEKHGLQVPSKVEDVRSLRRMIDEGTISVGNFTETPEETDA